MRAGRGYRLVPLPLQTPSLSPPSHPDSMESGNGDGWEGGVVRTPGFSGCVPMCPFRTQTLKNINTNKKSVTSLPHTHTDTRVRR